MGRARLLEDLAALAREDDAQAAAGAAERIASELPGLLGAIEGRCAELDACWAPVQVAVEAPARRTTHPTSRSAGRVEAEIEILRELAGTTDPKARQRLQGRLIVVGEWQRQIEKLAGKWERKSSRGTTREDLVAAGYVGLLRAAALYDPARAGWPSFAYMYVEREIDEWCRRSEGVVISSQYEVKVRRAVERAERAGGEVDAVAVAARARVSVAAVREYLAAPRRQSGWRSLNFLEHE